MRQYKLVWQAGILTLTNPTGRRVSLTEIGYVYWRKPFTTLSYDDTSDTDHFFHSECQYLVREIYNVARSMGAYALVEAGAERRLGKLLQLRLATRHFNVPNWRVHLGDDWCAPPDTVAKSLSGEPVSEHSVLYATRVGNQILDGSYVRLTQREVKKSSDLTVCFVDGDIFAFELASIVDASLDWRSEIASGVRWKLVNVPDYLLASVRSFMGDCNLNFGRLDFAVEDGVYYFLEVNPNGQWAWLDPGDQYGLVTAVVDAVRGRGRNNADTPRA